MCIRDSPGTERISEDTAADAGKCNLPLAGSAADLPAIISMDQLPDV